MPLCYGRCGRCRILRPPCIPLRWFLLVVRVLLGGLFLFLLLLPLGLRCCPPIQTLFFILPGLFLLFLCLLARGFLRLLLCVFFPLLRRLRIWRGFCRILLRRRLLLCAFFPLLLRLRLWRGFRCRILLRRLPDVRYRLLIPI